MKAAAGLGLTGLAATGGYLATQQSVSLGLIGAGIRGNALVRTLRRRFYRAFGEFKAVCDVDRTRAAQVQAAYCPSAEIYQDYRQVLQRDDIAAVIVATPDHWHARITTEALQLGKAVYCEKPLTLTIDEGKRLVETVRQTKGTLLVGTQNRSDPLFQQACELVRNGRVGKLKRVTVQINENPASQPYASAPIPSEFDWDMWLGRAPWVEYCPQRTHETFRFWYDYAGGEIADWGCHYIDIAQWAMGVDHAGPLSIDGEAQLPRVANGYDVPQRFEVQMQYPDDVALRIVNAKRNGLLFEGDEGRIFVNRGGLYGKPAEELKDNPLPTDAVRYGHERRYWTIGGGKHAHLQHFLDCVLTGCRPISDVVTQHRAASACHLANLCLRLGRQLHWDPQQEVFLNDPDANAMLSRPQREPICMRSKSVS